MQYEYAKTDRSEAVLTVADLKKLPEQLRKELAEAAVVLDNEAVLAVVDRLRNDYPAEAELIAELVSGFRFDKIMELYSKNALNDAESGFSLNK